MAEEPEPHRARRRERPAGGVREKEVTAEP